MGDGGSWPLFQVMRWKRPAGQLGQAPFQFEWQRDGVEGVDRQAAARGDRVEVHRIMSDRLEHAGGLAVERERDLQGRFGRVAGSAPRRRWPLPA